MHHFCTGISIPLEFCFEQYVPYHFYCHLHLTSLHKPALDEDNIIVSIPDILRVILNWKGSDVSTVEWCISLVHFYGIRVFCHHCLHVLHCPVNAILHYDAGDKVPLPVEPEVWRERGEGLFSIVTTVWFNFLFLCLPFSFSFTLLWVTWLYLVMGHMFSHMMGHLTCHMTRAHDQSHDHGLFLLRTWVTMTLYLCFIYS